MNHHILVRWNISANKWISARSLHGMSMAHFPSQYYVSLLSVFIRDSRIVTYIAQKENSSWKLILYAWLQGRGYIGPLLFTHTFNPCCAEFIWGNLKIYSHFIKFLKVQQEQAYPTLSVPILLTNLATQGVWHRQVGYWPISSGIFRSQNNKS